jgi:hypothetical protein
MKNWFTYWEYNASIITVIITFALIALGVLVGNKCSAQATVVKTTEVDILNLSCDTIEVSFELDCTIAILGSSMVLTEGNNPPDIIKVWYLDSYFDETGTWDLYEYDTGYVYINANSRAVSIEDEAGCIDYYNK